MTDRPVTLAAITGAHGVAGEVRLKLFGESVESLGAHRLFNGGAIQLEKLRSDNKGGAVARFAGVTDRTAAEALRGTTLSVPRCSLPALEEGEFYHADLLGLLVTSDTGTAVGTVIAVENFGASDIIEIKRPDGRSFMVPLTPAAVIGWSDSGLTLSHHYDQP